jgi:hypothetical protein
MESDRKRKESQKKIDEGRDKLWAIIAEAKSKAQSRAAITAAARQKIDERFNVKKEPAKTPAKETPMKELKLNITPARAAKAKQVMSEIDENSRPSENARKNINIRAVNDLEKKPIDVLKRMQSGAKTLMERHPGDQKWKNWYETVSMIIKKREEK